MATNNLDAAKAFRLATLLGAGIFGGTAALHPDVENTPRNIAEATAVGGMMGLGTVGLGHALHKNPRFRKSMEEFEKNLKNKL